MYKDTFTVVLQGLPRYLKRQIPLAPKPCFCLKPGPSLIYIYLALSQNKLSVVTFLLSCPLTCCVLFLRDLSVTYRALQHASMMLGTSAWCHQTTSATLTYAMSSPLPTFVPPSPDLMGVPLRYPSSLASLPGEKAQAGTLLHPACHPTYPATKVQSVTCMSCLALVTARILAHG